MELSLMTFMCEIQPLMDGPWSEEKSIRIEELLRIAAETGFSGVDMIAGTIEAMGPDRVRKILNDKNLKLNSIICIGELADPSGRDEEVQAPYIRAIDAAVFFDCPHLMLVPGSSNGSADTSAIVQALERRFRNITQAAADKGISCMIEDDPDLFAGICAQADVRHMLEAVPGLKLVYDSANMIVAGEDPVQYYEGLHEYVIHTHIKDMAVCEDPSAYRNPGSDGRYYANVPHGKGLVDFDALFGSFRKYGYDGVLSLEYVPDESLSVRDDIERVYKMTASLVCKYNVGINEVGLIPVLQTQPYEDVWRKLKELGTDSVELCYIPDHNERIRQYAAELGKQFEYGMPECMPRGEKIYDMVNSIHTGGLKTYSCHVMLCEAYPELIWECVPEVKEIARRTGIRQFVVSCMFSSEEMTGQYLPFLQKAAQSLKENDIILCYHNHHMDCIPFEHGKSAMDMVIEECPDCMIQLDAGWAWYGNMDVVRFMKEHGSRIASVHLKDLTADARERSDEGRFVAMGAGSAPIKEAVQLMPWCNIAPGKLIFDQDASTDIYADIKYGIKYVQNC